MATMGREGMAATLLECLAAVGQPIKTPDYSRTARRLVFRDKRASRWFWRRAGDSRNSLVATYHVNAKETLFEA